jgi:hypothetical protein
MIERCAGIDVGRKFVVCVMVGDAHAEPSQQVRKFSTLNEGLEQLQEWLHQNQLYAGGDGERRLILETDL